MYYQKDLFLCLSLSYLFFFFRVSPWYNRNGWLGVKHLVTYLWFYLSTLWSYSLLAEPKQQQAGGFSTSTAVATEKYSHYNKTTFNNSKCFRFMNMTSTSSFLLPSTWWHMFQKCHKTLFLLPRLCCGKWTLCITACFSSFFHVKNWAHRESRWLNSLFSKWFGLWEWLLCSKILNYLRYHITGAV